MQKIEFMYRYISVVFLGIFTTIACQSDCEDNAPKPLSLNIRWVDAQGNDAYASKKYNADSLEAYYHFDRKKTKVALNVSKYKDDSTKHYVDAMPLVRTAYALRVDTVFISADKTDIDTIAINIKKEENDCFSTIYHFEKLRYNEIDLSGTEDFYIIKK